MATEDGVICTLTATHYLLDVSIGYNGEDRYSTRFAFDTGAGFNIIRRSALPWGWQKQVDEMADPPILNDANGRPLELRESGWLTVRFANTLYRVKFIIADRLTVEVIIGTAFLNRHVIAILCTKQRIRFRNGEIPIVEQLEG